MKRRFCRSPRKNSSKVGDRQSGQIVVEYILVLIVAVALAFVIVRGFINREEGNEGLVIQAWMRMLGAIGSDTADDIKRAN